MRPELISPLSIIPEIHGEMICVQQEREADCFATVSNVSLRTWYLDGVIGLS